MFPTSQGKREGMFTCTQFLTAEKCQVAKQIHERLKITFFPNWSSYFCKKPSKFSINLLVQVTVYMRYLYEWLILLFMVLFWGKCSYFEPHSSKLFTLVTGCCWLSRIREICIWGERRLKTSNMRFKTHVLKESKRILFNQNASRRRSRADVP